MIHSSFKDETVRIITYEDNVEDWKCQYAILDDHFLFLGGKLNGTKVLREGREFPNRGEMQVFSSPIIHKEKELPYTTRCL